MKILFRYLLPILILAGAVYAADRLVKSRKPPERKPTAENSVLVKTMTAVLGETAPLIRISGTVMPSRQLDMRPQVGGQIVEISPKLQPGGHFRQGEILLRIDPRDYEFNVERRKAELERARFELETEKGQARVAEQEWQLLGKELESSPQGRELSLRLPHLRRAQANLEAAESSLAEARLNLERTTVRAPFDLMVRSENVDLGQVISTQSTIAILTGTARYWVKASIPVEQLAMLSLPDAKGQGGSPVTVIHAAGASETRKPGQILRLLGDLDPAGRMARLLIGVDDPLALKAGEDRLPLLMDAYVQVEIEGKALAATVALPPYCVHEGNKVWLASPDDRLEIRAVEVVWEERDRILLAEGLQGGERVITSRIATPLPGLKLRYAASAQEGEQSAGGAP